MQMQFLRKNVILSDSMIKGWNIKQFNSHIRGGKVFLKAFPGTKTEKLNHRVKPSPDE